MAIPLIGTSESIEKIRELIEHVADTGLNVIITGESGVGKEVVAQNLFHESQRKDKPFIKVNCAALPDGLLESELFGFERGAFTGADRKKRGKFELAHEGVIFLDEIGDMSLNASIQASSRSSRRRVCAAGFRKRGKNRCLGYCSHESGT